MNQHKTLFLILLVFISCKGDGEDHDPGFIPGEALPCYNNSCTPTIPPFPVFDTLAVFPNWLASEYKLPFRKDSTYRVNQGNTSGFGHSNFWRFGYDFDMCIGTEILAARAGTVVHANDGARDGDRNRTNLITIQHEDGTVALYSHLTRNGVLVTAGQQVEQGDLIGLSGDTGNTGGLPHLHFSLHPCTKLPGLSGEGGDCSSIPVNFRNAGATPHGLGTGRCITAR